MITPKRTCTEFLIFKYGKASVGVRNIPLFERELATLFAEYKQWHRDKYDGRNPSGVKQQLFRRWLILNKCFFVPKRGK